MVFTPCADAARLQASVARRGITRIYHYTGVSNLRSILSHGAVYCRARMDGHDIEYAGHGWGRTGKDEELKDYICCSFVPHWGMLSKETEPQAVLALTLNLIWRAGSLFCPGNSASNEFDLDTLEANTTVEAFDAMFDNPNTSWPRTYQCEVLVREEISLDHLISINFQTAEHKDEAVAQLKGMQVAEAHRKIRVAVNPLLYPPKR